MMKDKSKAIPVSRILSKGKRFRNDNEKERKFHDKAKRLRKFHAEKKKILEELDFRSRKVVEEVQALDQTEDEEEDPDLTDEEDEIDETSPLDGTLCKFFQQGKCTRADCQYIHLKDGSSSLSSGKRKRKPCKFYHSRGGCQKGDQCKFEHEGEARFTASKSSPKLNGFLSIHERVEDQRQRRIREQKEIERLKTEKQEQRAKWKKKLSYKTKSGQPMLKYRVLKVLSDLKSNS